MTKVSSCWMMYAKDTKDVFLSSNLLLAYASAIIQKRMIIWAPSNIMWKNI